MPLTHKRRKEASCFSDSGLKEIIFGVLLETVTYNSSMIRKAVVDKSEQVPRSQCNFFVLLSVDHLGISEL